MPRSRIFYHRREPDGRYVMLVHTDERKWVIAVDGEWTPADPDVAGVIPEPAYVRRFEWGPVPIVPSLPSTVKPDAYSAIHDRELVPGEPFVTEDEYVYLQICEARETLALEAKEDCRRSHVLPGEGEAL